MSKDLQAVLVGPHKLLVDIQHGQQDIEQVGCGEINIDTRGDVSYSNENESNKQTTLLVKKNDYLYNYTQKKTSK